MKKPRKPKTSLLVRAINYAVKNASSGNARYKPLSDRMPKLLEGKRNFWK